MTMVQGSVTVQQTTIIGSATYGGNTVEGTISLNSIRINGTVNPKITAVGVSNGLPASGQSGEVLVKNSANDYDSGWSSLNNLTLELENALL